MEKATEIIAYSPETGKPVLGIGEDGKLSRLDENGNILNRQGEKVASIRPGLQKVAGRGIDWVGWKATVGILAQSSILPKDSDIEDAITRTGKKGGKSILGAIRARQDSDAVAANFMLERLSPDQLDATVRHFVPTVSDVDLRLMSDKAKRESIMKADGSSLKKLKDYIDGNFRPPAPVAGAPSAASGAAGGGVKMSVPGFYKAYYKDRGTTGTANEDILRKVAVLNDRNISNEQLAGLAGMYDVPVTMERSKLVNALAKS